MLAESGRLMTRSSGTLLYTLIFWRAFSPALFTNRRTTPEIAPTPAPMSAPKGPPTFHPNNAPPLPSGNGQPGGNAVAIRFSNAELPPFWGATIRLGLAAVVLWLIVDQNGHPRDVKVARSLGMGLDQKAVQAVRNWKFEPAMKDGKPVLVRLRY